MKKIIISLIFVLMAFVVIAQDEALTIDAEGNVGINNSEPEATLDVNGLIAQQNVFAYTPDTQDIVHTLPDAAVTGLEISIFWNCTGGTELLLATLNAQTINGDEAAVWKGQGRKLNPICPSLSK